jgi:hypothetical protein
MTQKKAEPPICDLDDVTLGSPAISFLEKQWIS